MLGMARRRPGLEGGIPKSLASVVSHCCTFQQERALPCVGCHFMAASLHKVVPGTSRTPSHGMFQKHISLVLPWAPPASPRANTC